MSRKIVPPIMRTLNAGAYLALNLKNSLTVNSFYSDISILPQNALKRDRNSKCIDLIEGHYLEVVVLLYIMIQ